MPFSILKVSWICFLFKSRHLEMNLKSGFQQTARIRWSPIAVAL